MTAQVKYLITVDRSTGMAEKVERLGSSGELTELAVPRAWEAVSQDFRYSEVPPTPVPMSHCERFEHPCVPPVVPPITQPLTQALSFEAYEYPCKPLPAPPPTTQPITQPLVLAYQTADPR